METARASSKRPPHRSSAFIFKAMDEFATDWGVDRRLLLALAVSMGFGYVFVCAGCIMASSRRRRSNNAEEGAAARSNADQAKERQDILADVYGDTAEHSEDDNK